MTTLSFVVLVLVSLSQVSFQFEAWSIHEKKCSKYLEDANDCWLQETGLPSCNGGDKLLDCLEESKGHVKFCKDDIKDSITTKYNQYKKMREAFCHNSELKSEFEKKPACWNSAKLCAQELAAVSSEENEEEDDCREILDANNNCNLKYDLCADIQSNFTMEIFETSGCAAHAESLIGGEDTSDNDANFMASCNSFIVVFLTILATSTNNLW